MVVAQAYSAALDVTASLEAVHVVLQAISHVVGSKQILQGNSRTKFTLKYVQTIIVLDKLCNNNISKIC